MVLDSPRTSGGSSFWGDRSAFRPRSLGSTTAMTSEASSSDSDSDDETKSRYDPDEMLSTPVMHKQSNSVGGVTPYGLREDTVTGGALHNPSPISRRYTPYRRATKSSGSRLAALRTQHNGEENNNSSGSSTDTNEMSVDNAASRRESISAVTSSLQLSTNSNSNSQDSDTETSPAPFRFTSPQVVRRPVTRRSNLLPKTKGFARIRAQLQEESSPVDTDIRRDAEVVRQVRIGSDSQNFVPSLSHASTYNSTTASSSPDLTPTIFPPHSMDASELGDIDGLGVTLPTTETSIFTPTATAGLTEEQTPRFSHLFQTNRFSTPPPQPFKSARKRSSSGAMSEDATTSHPTSHRPTLRARSESEPERESIPPPMFAPPNLPSAAEVSSKAHGKRRRDDDFDSNSIKRRAVSPGMSVHSSPVMGQSPVSSTGGWWASTGTKGRDSRENSGGGTAPSGAAANVGISGGSTNAVASGRENSGSSTFTGKGSTDATVTATGTASATGSGGAEATLGREGRSASVTSLTGAMAPPPPSTPSLGARRVGLQQGMSDTNDGLVRMSLE
ncbi:MAG: hypothetical protein Q9162_003342 [Coniocarpon cinnabarinum]